MSAFKDKVLPLVKSYGLMGGLGLVALVALPLGVWFSMEMSSAYRDELQKKVTADFDAVSKFDNTYFIQGVGEKLLEKKAPLNAELTAWYDARWKDVQGKVGVVWDKGLAFNKGEHELLLKEGMFPEPPQLEREVRTRDLVKAVIEFHTKILADANAGMPPEPAQMAGRLKEAASAAFAKLQAEKGTAGELDAADRAKIAAEVLSIRIGAYRARAQELGVYADVNVFEGIPREVSITTPSVAQAWDWQERSWAHHDVLKAVAEANKGLKVPEATVKRIGRVNVGRGGYDPTSPTPASYEPGDDTAALDFSKSPTGRVSGPGTKNKWYDIRPIELDLVVASQRLPSFIDALAKVNFLSVLDIQLTQFEPNEDLARGFYYGDEPVVRVKLMVESVWLREWRKDWIPDEVKKALAMKEGVVIEGSGSGGGAGGGGGGATGGGARRGGGRAGGRQD